MPQQLTLFSDLELVAQTEQLIAGVDEVGRGALFGPVVAAAVILAPEAATTLVRAGVTDSKKLSAMQRQNLIGQIKQQSIDCQVGYASVREIDRLNILQATLLAMQRAVAKLAVRPDLCLVDGNCKIPNLAIPQQTLVKGDQRSLAIAAASILAKVWRDELIVRMAKRYPDYGLCQNKGYGTLQHRQAIQVHGISRYHRQSFAPCQVLTADSERVP